MSRRDTDRRRWRAALGATIALGALAVLLAACGSESAPASEESAAPEPAASEAPPDAAEPADPPDATEGAEEPAAPATPDPADPPADDQPPDTPQPLDIGPLSAGSYATVGFTPRFTFQVSDNLWAADFDDSDIFQIFRPTKEGFLSIGRGGGVIEPGTTPVPRPLPDDIVGWLAEHPDLATEPPRDADVDGNPATILDVEALADTQLFVRPRGDPGVTVGTQTPNDVIYGLNAGMRATLTVVEVAGETIVISIDGAPESWDEYEPIAQAVVDTIDFIE